MIEKKLNKKYFIAISLSIVLIISIAFWHLWRIQHELIYDQIKQQARSIFTTLSITHRWNVGYKEGYIKKWPDVETGLSNESGTLPGKAREFHSGKNPTMMADELS